MANYRRLAISLAARRAGKSKPLADLTPEDRERIRLKHKRENEFFDRPDRKCKCPVCSHPEAQKEGEAA